MRSRTASALLGLALAVGCVDPEPPPPPPPPPPVMEAPPQATETPTVTIEGPPRPQEPVSITMTSRTFAPALLERIRLNDLVDVELVQRGGRARGSVKIIRPDELVLTMEGTQIVTRLHPEDVRDITVISRQDDRLDMSTLDEPRSPEESWLERYALRPALTGQPADLWSGRFGPNVALPVTRAFTLTAFNYVSVKGGGAVFTPSATRATLREGDALKVTGVVHGLEQRVGTTDRVLGDIYLYLLRRGAQVLSIFSPDLLHPSDLERASVDKFVAEQPVTFTAYRLGQERRYVRILRIPARLARTYMLHLERTPERSALRSWRAQGNPGLGEAEKAVRALYGAVRLTTDAELAEPLMFDLQTVDVATGGLRIVPFRKELGMD